MINPPPRTKRALNPISIDARPSDPLGRAVFTALIIRLIRAGHEQQAATPKHIADAQPLSVSSTSAAQPAPRKVAS